MPRGGAREGKPGKAYGNRVDLNEPVPGGPYGARKAQTDAMNAVPIQPPKSASPGAAMAGQAPPPVPPLPFDRPSERPGEPVTAGLESGPGPGPEALGMGDGPLDELRAIYHQFPSEDLRELLEYWEQGA